MVALPKPPPTHSCPRGMVKGKSPGKRLSSKLGRCVTGQDTLPWSAQTVEERRTWSLTPGRGLGGSEVGRGTAKCGALGCGGASETRGNLVAPGQAAKSS